MKAKMSFAELKAMFNDPAMIGADTSDANVISDATRRGHKHAHNHSRRPHVGNISPAEYRRRHMGKRS